MSGAARARARRQAGLSLIELMIALVLGLVVLAAVFNVYAGTAKSQRYTTGLQSMQENGRFGLSALQRGFRLAGFSSNDPAFVALGDSGDGKVTVRAERRYDCNGGDTSVAPATGVAENTYELVGKTIVCTGNVSDGSEVLVENVDAFRVLYGIDTDAGPVAGGDGVPNRFVRWADVGDPREVVALRFALLVSSGDPVRSRAVAEDHVVLDQVVPKDDRLLHEVFSTTVQLRNRSL